MQNKIKDTCEVFLWEMLPQTLVCCHKNLGFEWSNMQEIQKGSAPALPAIVHKRSQMIKDADAHIYFHL